MTYQFRSADGRTIERNYPMTSAIPATVEEGDTEFIRVFHAPAVTYRGMGFNLTDKGDAIERWKRENIGDD